MASSSGCAQRAGERPSPGAAGKGASGSRSEATHPDQRFPRFCRLTSRRQFLSVYTNGRRIGTPAFTLFGLPNDLGHCRLGLTVPRRVGGAVRRNRVKRVLREAFRRNRWRLEPALDLIVNAHPPIVECTALQLEREFMKSFARLARRISG